MKDLAEIKKTIELAKASNEPLPLVVIKVDKLAELVQQAEKYRLLEDTWVNGKTNPHYDVFRFVRTCKEVFDISENPKKDHDDE